MMEKSRKKFSWNAEPMMWFLVVVLFAYSIFMGVISSIPSSPAKPSDSEYATTRCIERGNSQLNTYGPLDRTNMGNDFITGLSKPNATPEQVIKSLCTRNNNAY